MASAEPLYLCPMPSALDTLNAALAGRYAIQRELGRGGMGAVYLVQDLKHDREVALKVLSPEVGGMIGPDRFQREIRIAAGLQHPHVCTVYDSGQADGLLWFTMPYVSGESLAARLEREQTLPLDEALRITIEVARALAYAHERGVVHRDIKPANLLLSRDGTALVTDFGIARAIGTVQARELATLTRPGLTVGTPAYMSPEQAAGDLTIDGRTDIFSLGIVLYEMLAGERPFQSQSAAAFARLLTERPPSVRRRRGELPVVLDEILSRALAPDPDRRFRSMTALADELSALRFGRHVAAERAASAAVLPFRDLSRDQDQAYFGDGLAEELTTALSRIGGLRVAARGGAFRYRGPSVDVREAGRELGVATVLTGSVRRSGERLRVSAQLSGVEEGYELWSETYDRHLADVFDVQEEIAGAIAAALKVKLLHSDSGPERPTNDLEAYDLFLRGRFAWHQRTGGTLPEAARCFEQAAARDPSFARAWAGLADACTLLPMYSGTSPTEAWPKAKAAALRAIALDPELADAHTSLAYGTMLFEWDWPAAEGEFQRAITADPDYQIAHHWYADFLAGRGRFEEALASMQRAHALDPLSRITGVELGWIYLLQRRMPEAEATINEVLRLDPGYAHAHFVLGQVLLADGRTTEAVTSLRHSIELGGNHAHGAAALVAALAASGRRDEAVEELGKLERLAASEYVSAFAFVVSYAALGKPDEAFSALDRGVAERDLLLAENFFEPLLDPLVADSRYHRIAALIRGSGLNAPGEGSVVGPRGNRP